jgi:hypothetical protein
MRALRASLGILLLAAIYSASATCHPCLPNGSQCSSNSDCCDGLCVENTCGCSFPVAVYTCMCDGVAAGDCSQLRPGAPCGPDGGAPGSDGGADGGGPSACQCVQTTQYETCG